jgi:hypothetical protein
MDGILNTPEKQDLSIAYRLVLSLDCYLSQKRTASRAETD